jgi:hypothetical protein
VIDVAIARLADGGRIGFWVLAVGEVGGLMPSISSPPRLSRQVTRAIDPTTAIPTATMIVTTMGPS